MKKEKLMTVAEYAASQGVTTKTVYQWIKNGTINYRQVGKIKLIIV